MSHFKRPIGDQLIYYLGIDQYIVYEGVRQLSNVNEMGLT